jgi:DNA-binding SARP family transcriptional activator
VTVETLLRRVEDGGTKARAGMRLTLLGSFELARDDQPLPVPLPAQRVLAYLALHGRPARRPYVACMLWTDSRDDRALGSLRSALWRLRQCARGAVESTDRGLRLAPTVAVDLHEASRLARQLLDPVTGVAALEVDFASLTSDLLPDWYDDWVLMDRERFRELRVNALEAVCERLSATGSFARAVDAGMSAVHCEPLRESAHRAVIRVHLAQGNRAQALLQYRLFRELLGERMGLQPSRQLEALVEDLL